MEAPNNNQNKIQPVPISSSNPIPYFIQYNYYS